MNAHQITPLSNTLEDGSNVPVVPAEAQKSKMFIMTSPENHKETVNFFKEHSFFGGMESSFVFFTQAMLPAMNEDGKIMMTSNHTLMLAPNGNGALFDSVKNE